MVLASSGVAGIFCVLSRAIKKRGLPAPFYMWYSGLYA